MHLQSLASLGWSAHFLSQLTLEDIPAATPARLTAIHRDRVQAAEPGGNVTLILPPDMPMSSLAVGDWVLYDGPRITRLLERKTLLTRRAAGSGAERQLLAANLDTLAIVTSCNADFSEGRIERYLAIAHSAGVVPILVLTKADMAAPEPYIDRARALDPSLPTIALDGRAAETAAALAPWCGAGQSLGLLGSSGVGKTTLAATLTGQALETGNIREDDARGRHTTRSRQMHRLASGGWLLDTPGMREVQMLDDAEGIAASFGDLAELATQCRFTNCHHDSEPGCAVRAALEAGDLDPARLARWKKLEREDASNTRTLAQAHARNRAFGKMAKSALKAKRGLRGEDV
jgi:ribosome biogenesis GTPase